MLSTIELQELFVRLGTPDAGRRLVEKARREAPVRKIESRVGNVITWLQSRKMARAIGTESRSGEYRAVVRYEHDPTVLEYFSQPCRLDLVLTDGGRIKASRVQHTPDFLVIRADQLLLEEWRDEGRLRRLAEKHPNRFRLEDGAWRFPEAEARLAELGIVYRIRTTQEHPALFVQNIDFLADYYDRECPPILEAEELELRALFSDRHVWTLADLIEATNGKVATDSIYKAIADDRLAFDLYEEDISETFRAKVYRDQTTLAFERRIDAKSCSEGRERLDSSISVGTNIEFDGTSYVVLMLGKDKALLQSDSGTTELSLQVLEREFASGTLRILTPACIDNEEADAEPLTPTEVERAVRRAEILDAALSGTGGVPVTTRTLQRWRKQMEEAGEDARIQYTVLAGNWKNCGNRARKIPQELLDEIAAIVKKEYNTATNKTKKSVYKSFVEACAAKGLHPCSQRTFNKEVTRLQSTRARRGKRVAYQTQPIVWYLKRDEPLHGVRPMQYVHVDHTQLDVRALSPETGADLGKPWLSLAIDAESRRVVGFYLSFEPPSYRSCMMVLRDVVRRHGRMPAMLVVDNGKEFKSRAFQRVCALYGCSIRYRPAGQPRHGGVLERLFGTINTQFIHNLAGNTQLMKYVRTVTKSVRPENFVEWTLPALHGAFDYYFDRLYGTDPHPAHGDAPVEHYTVRMAETGMRRHRLVRFDRTFLIETCPAPDSIGSRVVDGQRGVKVDHIWYWNDAFRVPTLDGNAVEVRVDPWDVRVLYALVRNKWVQCVSKLAARLRSYSVVELRYAFEELRKKAGIEKKDLTPERAAEWLKILDAKNFDSRLREQQAESRLIYVPLGMTSVEIPSAPDVEPSVIISTTTQPAKKGSSPSTDAIGCEDSEEEYELL